MYKERVQKLRRKLKRENLEAFLIAKPQNCDYLSGFKGSNCCLLVTENRQLLFTDFRYITQAKEEARDFEIILWQEPIWTNLAHKIKGSGINSLGIEAHFFTVKQYHSLSQALQTLNIKPLSDIVEELRMVKNRQEIGKIKQAAALADLALERVFGDIKPGIAEVDLALELEYQMRRGGAESASFEVIVASGERSSLPHARPTKKKLREGDLVLVDFGAKFEGYNSDMSRTFALGKISSEKERLFRIVHEAQNKALEAIGVCKEAAAVDSAARGIISQAGWENFFGHGTGHGLGLEVHEAPIIGPHSKDILLAGMVFAIEPAVYLPQVGGVRIEDSVYLGEGGIEVLSKFSKELMVL